MGIQKFIQHFIKLRLKELKKNQKWLAFESETSDSQLSQLLSGYSDMKIEKAEKLLNAVGYKICITKMTEWDK